MENAIWFENTPADIEALARFVKTMQENGVQFAVQRESRANQFSVTIWSPEGDV